MIHCDLYLYADKELNCSKHDYLRGYAYPTCELMHSFNWRYKDLEYYDSESRLSARNFMLCVASSLQQYFSEWRRTYKKIYLDQPNLCDLIAEVMFQYEVEIYRDCGFCLLSRAWPLFNKTIRKADNMKKSIVLLAHFTSGLFDSMNWPQGDSGFMDTRNESVISYLTRVCTFEYARLRSENYTRYVDKTASLFKSFSKTFIMGSTGDLNAGLEFDKRYSDFEKSAAEDFPADESFCHFLKAFFQQNSTIEIDCGYVYFYFVCLLICPVIPILFLHFLKRMVDIPILLLHFFKRMINLCWGNKPTQQSSKPTNLVASAVVVSASPQMKQIVCKVIVDVVLPPGTKLYALIPRN